MDTDKIFREILRDIRVELLDEFDKNFERGAFFNGKPWPRSMRPGAKSALIDSGALRRSLRGVTQKDTIEFSSSLPYASIHNCGGTLTVTTRMKRYFWAKHIEAAGGMSKTKSGKTANTQRNRNLNAKAAFYKAMALKRVGSKIHIPQRQFLGHHDSLVPVVEKIAVRHLEQALKDHLPHN